MDATSVSEHDLRNELAARRVEAEILHEDLKTAHRLMETLIASIGAHDICPECGAEAVWIRHRNRGSAVLHNADGSEHRATCPGPRKRR